MVTIINTWLRILKDRGHALKNNNADCWLETGNEQLTRVKVRCFVDPSIHPDLLPAQT